MPHSNDPESQTDRIYIYDTDYRCDPWDEPTIYDTKARTFKIQISNPQEKTETTTEFPPPLSTILKKSETIPSEPAAVTFTPIDAENIICFEHKRIWSKQAKQQREIIIPSPSQPQTTPNNNERGSNRMPTTTASRPQGH